MNTNTPNEVTAPDETPVDVQAEALTAMSAALNGTETADEPVVEEEPVEPVAEVTEIAAEPVTTEPVEPTPQPDAEVEAEIQERGLQGKTADRFRTMSAEIKTFAPLREALDAAGIKDVAELPKVVERAKVADDLVSMVTETGASAQQYGEALDYLRFANDAATTGNVESAKKALEILRPAYEGLAKLVGLELPGIHDPLAEHADLRGEVEAGDLTRERAVEIANTRNRDKMASDRTALQGQHQAEQERAIAHGRQSLNDLERDLRELDPAGYDAKRPELVKAVASIRQKYAPHQWATQAALAFSRIKAPAAASAPKATPVAGTPQRRALAPETNDPLDAMRQANSRS